jgi:adenylate cyclase
MFVDIRGFTAMSEQLSPEAVMEFLNDYFGHVSHLVFAFQGMVNKFIGDGLMAVWGVPGAGIVDHASQAVDAALAIRAKVAELNDHRKVEGKEPIRIGIGIHTGPVVAGNLGSKELIEYTVVGDTVNLASRLEAVTKEHQVDLVVSGSTWAAIEGQFSGTKLSDEVIRGKQLPVAVYTIDRRLASSERQKAGPVALGSIATAS